MYIARTRKKYKDRYHEQILLRESYREDGKVKSRTLLNLTNKPVEQVGAIVAALKSKDELYVSTDQQYQGKTVGFSFVVLHIMRVLGIVKAVGKSFEARVALVLIAARVVLQGSRLQSLFWAKEDDKILDLLNYTEYEKDKLNVTTQPI